MNMRKRRRRAKFKGPSVFFSVDFLFKMLDAPIRPLVLQRKRK
jgi:hypothetical protein